nr:hypothetical protein [Bacteroides intestinalis]
MENKQCNECIWNGRSFCSKMSKELPFPECIKNSALNKAQDSVLEQLFNKEYNISKSAQHPTPEGENVR